MLNHKQNKGRFDIEMLVYILRSLDKPTEGWYLTDSSDYQKILIKEKITKTLSIYGAYFHGKQHNLPSTN